MLHCREMWKYQLICIMPLRLMLAVLVVGVAMAAEHQGNVPGQCTALGCTDSSTPQVAMSMLAIPDRDATKALHNQAPHGLREWVSALRPAQQRSVPDSAATVYPQLNASVSQTFRAGMRQIFRAWSEMVAFSNPGRWLHPVALLLEVNAQQTEVGLVEGLLVLTLVVCLVVGILFVHYIVFTPICWKRPEDCHPVDEGRHSRERSREVFIPRLPLAELFGRLKVPAGRGSASLVPHDYQLGES